MSGGSKWFFITERIDIRCVLPHVIIALAAFLVFAGTLTHGFVWDDEDVIYHARSIVEEEGPAGLLKAPFTADQDEGAGNSGYYRPVSLLSMWLNDPFSQPSPFLYHLFNVLLHVVNSVLVFVLFRYVLGEEAGAFLGGLIFAVHPVHAESVAWISGRTDLLAALLTLVTVILWRHSRRRKESRRIGFYVLGFATFMLACLAKETAFLLPIIAILWALTDRYRSPRTTAAGVYPDMVWIVGWCAVLGLVIRLRTVFMGGAMETVLSSGVLQGDAVLPAAMGEVLKNLAVYLRFLSFPSSLRVYYPPSQPALTFLTLAVSAGFLLLCLVFSGRRHRGIGIVALAWILLFLGPVTGFISLGLSVVAERFCYLPSVGFALLAGYVLGLVYHGTSWRRTCSALVAVLVTLLGLGCVMHASGWKDDVTFFEEAINNSPVTIANMYYNLGNAYVEAGAIRRGIETLEKAIQRYPDYKEAILNLAAAHIRLGENERALEVLEKAEAVAHNDDSLWSNKAVVLEILGRTQEALEAYDKAAELDPMDPVAQYHRANLLYRLGRYEESLAAYNRVRTIDPGHYGGLIGSGRSLEAMNKLDAAVEAYLKAVEERPDESVGYLGLGRVLLGQGRTGEAAAVYRVALDRGNVDAALHRGLVIAYFQSGKIAEVHRHINSLARENPSLSRELSSLADDLTGQGTTERKRP